MHIVLFDRSDRLGSNIGNYIAQILYAHNNKDIRVYICACICLCLCV